MAVFDNKGSLLQQHEVLMVKSLIFAGIRNSIYRRCSEYCDGRMISPGSHFPNKIDFKIFESTPHIFLQTQSPIVKDQGKVSLFF